MNRILPFLSTVLMYLGANTIAHAQSVGAKNPFSRPVAASSADSASGAASASAGVTAPQYPGTAARVPGQPNAAPTYRPGVGSQVNSYTTFPNSAGAPGVYAGTQTPGAYQQPSTVNADEAQIEEIPNAVRLGKFNGVYVYKGGSPSTAPSRATPSAAANSGTAAPSANIAGGSVYVFEATSQRKIVRKPGARVTPMPGGATPETMGNPYAVTNRPNLPSMVGTRAPSSGSN